MNSNAHPTILLVPGAFTGPSCYDLLLPYLKNAGHPVAVASLASCDPERPYDHTAETEGRQILDNYLLPLLDDGKDVIVFAHSFGATCLTGAGQRLFKHQRKADGLPGGIFGLIYFSFAMCVDGQSQIEYLGGKWPPFCKLHHPREGVYVFDPVIDKLFNDAEPERQQQLAVNHLPHSMNVFETHVSKPLWTDAAFEGQRVLIKTMLDATFPPDAQQMFADRSGVQWRTVEVEAGHEGFLTKSEEFATTVLDSIEHLKAN